MEHFTINWIADWIAWPRQHAETLLGVVLALIISIPVGFYLSLYSGLIVARWARFEDLRYELIRILQSLEWPPGSQTFVLVGGHRSHEIILISCDLVPLGHTDAGETVMRIGNEVYNELDRRSDFLSPEQKEEQFGKWMRAARTMRPNKWAIVDPRPRLYKPVEYDAETNCEG